MKKLLIIALLLISQLSYAQTDKEILGDSTEQRWQLNMKLNSSHKHGALFYKAKFGNLVELMAYASSLGCSSHIDMSDGEDYIAYETSCGLHGEHIEARAYCDPSLTMNKVVVSGPAEKLVQLFLFYWKSDIKAEKLKRGVVVYQDVASDRVTFSWSAKNPTIIITSNPNMPVPWLSKR